MHARIRFFVALIAVGACLATGCEDETKPGPTTTIFGSGNVVEVERTVEGFSALEHASIGAVHVSFGPTEGLRIVAEDNLVDEILTEVVGGVLHIRTRAGVRMRPTEDIDLYLDAKALDTLSLTGVGGIEGPSLPGDTLDLSISGVGELSFQGIDAQSVLVAISGVGDVNLGGVTVEEEITVAGVADVDTAGLQAASCSVRVEGTATMRVRASDVLSFLVNGDADLCYFGDPQLEISIAGAGTISTCD